MAYFDEHAEIFYLSENHVEKQEIEDGLNRKLTVIRSLGGFVEAYEEATNRTDYVTVIITEGMGEEFSINLPQIVGIFNALIEEKSLQVIEIGLGETFDDAITFSDITSFLEFSRGIRREARIKKLDEDGGEEELKESALMRELMIEVDVVKERLVRSQVNLDKKEEELEEEISKHQLLKTEVSNVYKIDIKNLELDVEELKEEVAELARQYKVEIEKVKDYERDLSKYRSDNKSLELEKKSLMDLVEKRKQEKRILDGELKSQQRMSKKLHEEKMEIYKSRVDGEDYLRLEIELGKERQKLITMKSELEHALVESKRKDFELAELETDIGELRAGEEDVQHKGRTTKLDKHTLKTTDVYYIKVITELPYLISTLKEFYKQIKERTKGRTHVAIIRNDEGLDSTYYKGLPLYGTLGDVRAEDEIFLLHPTRRMFTGAERFDANVDAIVVLDFIRSKEYYLDTEAFSKIITVVQDSGMIRKLGLTGTPVSIDAGSKLDIRYDSKIEEARMKYVRDSMVKRKVDNWMRAIGIE